MPAGGCLLSSDFASRSSEKSARSHSLEPRLGLSSRWQGPPSPTPPPLPLSLPALSMSPRHGSASNSISHLVASGRRRQQQQQHQADLAILNESESESRQRHRFNQGESSPLPFSVSSPTSNSRSRSNHRRWRRRQMSDKQGREWNEDGQDDKQLDYLNCKSLEQHKNNSTHYNINANNLKRPRELEANGGGQTNVRLVGDRDSMFSVKRRLFRQQVETTRINDVGKKRRPVVRLVSAVAPSRPSPLTAPAPAAAALAPKRPKAAETVFAIIPITIIIIIITITMIVFVHLMSLAQCNAQTLDVMSDLGDTGSARLEPLDLQQLELTAPGRGGKLAPREEEEEEEDDDTSLEQEQWPASEWPQRTSFKRRQQQQQQQQKSPSRTRIKATSSGRDFVALVRLWRRGQQTSSPPWRPPVTQEAGQAAVAAADEEEQEQDNNQNELMLLSTFLTSDNKDINISNYNKNKSKNKNNSNSNSNGASLSNKLNASADKRARSGHSNDMNRKRATRELHHRHSADLILLHQNQQHQQQQHHHYHQHHHHYQNNAVSSSVDQQQLQLQPQLQNNHPASLEPQALAAGLSPLDEATTSFTTSQADSPHDSTISLNADTLLADSGSDNSSASLEQQQQLAQAISNSESGGESENNSLAEPDDSSSANYSNNGGNNDDEQQTNSGGNNNNNNSNNNSQQQENQCDSLDDILAARPSPAVGMALGMNYVIIFAFGLFGNVVTLYVLVCKGRSKCSVQDILIANLACSDIMLCVFAVPITPKYLILDGHWTLGSALCKVVSFAQSTSVYMSTYSLICIGYIRYRLIVHPLGESMSKRTALLSCLGTWLVGIMVTLPYMLQVRLSPENCPIKFCDEAWEKPYRFIFSLFTAFFQFMIPLGSVGFFNKKIYSRLDGRGKKQQQQQQRQQQPKQITSNTQNGNNNSNNNNNTNQTLSPKVSIKIHHKTKQSSKLGLNQNKQDIIERDCNSSPISLGPKSDVIAIKEQRQREKERRMRKANNRLIFVVVIFAHSWLPLNLFNIAQDYFEAMLHWPYLTNTFLIVHQIACSSVCWNPILYAWMSETYRQDLRQALPRCIVRHFRCLAEPQHLHQQQQQQQHHHHHHHHHHQFQLVAGQTAKHQRNSLTQHSNVQREVHSSISHRDILLVTNGNERATTTTTTTTSTEAANRAGGKNNPKSNSTTHPHQLQALAGKQFTASCSLIQVASSGDQAGASASSLEQHCGQPNQIGHSNLAAGSHEELHQHNPKHHQHRRSMDEKQIAAALGVHDVDDDEKGNRHGIVADDDNNDLCNSTPPPPPPPPANLEAAESNFTISTASSSPSSPASGGGAPARVSTDSCCALAGD